MADRQNTTPDVPRGEGGKWKAGASPNPGGRPKKIRDIEAAILKAETPERVTEVINAMRLMALSGEKEAPAAAKVYLERVLGPVKDLDIDLSDASEETIRYLAEHGVRTN
jgi:fructose-1,6-bisphosphatase/sedoheptulose 1,7-bisphosphatase-like protein